MYLWKITCTISFNKSLSQVGGMEIILPYLTFQRDVMVIIKYYILRLQIRVYTQNKYNEVRCNISAAVTIETSTLLPEITKTSSSQSTEKGQNQFSL